MRRQCECVNVKHSPRCGNTATLRCTHVKCGTTLCKPCAKNHHAHGKQYMERIEEA